MSEKTKVPRRTSFLIDSLSCKKEVVRLIIEGKSLRSICDFIKASGEDCSKSSVDRYIRHKFIEGKINPDKTIELKEKEGIYTRITKYPADNDDSRFKETKLYVTNTTS